MCLFVCVLVGCSVVVSYVLCYNLCRIVSQRCCFGVLFLLMRKLDFVLN